MIRIGDIEAEPTPIFERLVCEQIARAEGWADE